LTSPGFKKLSALLYVPDGSSALGALQRTSHLAIAAHPDDIEIMAYPAIARCFRNPEEWFTAAIVTDGSVGLRSGPYAGFSDSQFAELRAREQQKAACIGEYSALVMLNYASSEIKDRQNRAVIEDLRELINVCRPGIIYTHNPADKHETHVAVALRVIEALRGLEPPLLPRKLFGCEVWRSLDWMTDQDKVIFDASLYPNLAAALLGVFDSQIGGGKRYDKATEGRRVANATFSESHATDEYQAVTFGMNLTPLIENPDMSVSQYVKEHMDRFSQEVINTLDNLSR